MTKEVRPKERVVRKRSTTPSEKAMECTGISDSWLEEFEAAARRPLATRLHYAFIRTYKPVLDDEPYRAFDTMEDYRRWCQEHLPDWLGYGRV